MKDLLSFFPLYIVLAGIVLSALSYNMLNKSSRESAKVTLAGGRNCYKLARELAEGLKLKCEMIVHDGTGTMYNRKDGKLYIAQQAALQKNYGVGLKCLYEVCEAKARENGSFLLKALDFVTFICKLASLPCPLVLVLAAFFKWVTVIKVILVIFAVNIVLAIVNVIIIGGHLKPLKEYLKGEDLKVEDKARVMQTADVLSLLPCTSVFLPFANTFGYLKNTVSVFYKNSDARKGK
ncbi:MAG: hypothetical protein IJL94_00510 [Erysipelotrichaceae bacterium]|nr:hypothetical protein [Erysipelotrichaceae bacterium]